MPAHLGQAPDAWRPRRAEPCDRHQTSIVRISLGFSGLGRAYPKHADNLWMAGLDALKHQGTGATSRAGGGGPGQRPPRSSSAGVDQIMTTSSVLSAKQLRQLIEQIERLEEEKKALAGDIRDKYLEAKAVGFDVKALRKIVSMRKKQDRPGRAGGHPRRLTCMRSACSTKSSCNRPAETQTTHTSWTQAE